MKPELVSELMDKLNQGVIYTYKRDKSYRPIFIINVKKMTKTNIDP